VRRHSKPVGFCVTKLPLRRWFDNRTLRHFRHLSRHNFPRDCSARYTGYKNRSVIVRRLYISMISYLNFDKLISRQCMVSYRSIIRMHECTRVHSISRLAAFVPEFDGAWRSMKNEHEERNTEDPIFLMCLSVNSTKQKIAVARYPSLSRFFAKGLSIRKVNLNCSRILCNLCNLLCASYCCTKFFQCE